VSFHTSHTTAQVGQSPWADVTRPLTNCTGSEAIETAIKIARQYHISNNDPDRTIILSRTDSYHGNTLGALAAGGNRPRRKPFEPLCSPAFQHVDRCFYPQDALPFESEQDYLNRLLASYEARFQELGPNKIAALLLEPVGGATLGTVIPVANYLARVRQLCNEHGALLIYDEVMCGMGRCGTYHAWEGFGGVAVAPDLQTIGKGLAAGYQPLSSVLVAGKIYGVMAKDRKNAFTNGHTYQGHALGCAAALAVQHVIFEHSLLDNVRQQGERLRSGLSSRLDSAWVSDTRGCGLFQTVEFRASKGGPVASRVRDLCFERGLALYVVSGGPDAILFAPPFVITDTEVDSVIDIFVSCVRDICETRPSL
jgi:adenosylmethionine-8-amino-7-oxononanoate aminotransferase